MSRFRKQSHVVHHCVYHIVWTPKYRFRILEGQIKINLEKIKNGKFLTILLWKHKENFLQSILTELQLEDIFKKYELNIPVHLFHSLEYYADLVFGESPTITTESAMLGTPSICVSSWAHGSLGNFLELGKYEMSYSFHPNDESLAIEKGIHILKNNEKVVFQNRAYKFMQEHIDLSAFLYWFILNYPKSHQKIKELPNYQDKFKTLNNA